MIDGRESMRDFREWAVDELDLDASLPRNELHRQALAALADDNFVPRGDRGLAVHILSVRDHGQLGSLDRMELTRIRRRHLAAKVDSIVGQAFQLPAHDREMELQRLKSQAHDVPELIARLERLATIWELELELQRHSNDLVEEIRDSLIQSFASTPQVTAVRLRKLFANAYDSPYQWKRIVVRFQQDCPRLSAACHVTVRELRTATGGQPGKIQAIEAEPDIRVPPAWEFLAWGIPGYLWFLKVYFTILFIVLAIAILVAVFASSTGKRSASHSQRCREQGATATAHNLELRSGLLDRQPDGRHSPGPIDGPPQDLLFVVSDQLLADLSIEEPRYREGVSFLIRLSELEERQKIRLQNLQFCNRNTHFAIRKQNRLPEEELQSPQRLVNFLKSNFDLTERQANLVNLIDGSNIEVHMLHRFDELRDSVDFVDGTERSSSSPAQGEGDE